MGYIVYVTQNKKINTFCYEEIQYALHSGSADVCSIQSDVLSMAILHILWSEPYVSSALLLS